MAYCVKALFKVKDAIQRISLYRLTNFSCINLVTRKIGYSRNLLRRCIFSEIKYRHSENIAIKRLDLVHHIQTSHETNCF